jgi:hypothetical protein
MFELENPPSVRVLIDWSTALVNYAKMKQDKDDVALLFSAAAEKLYGCLPNNRNNLGVLSSLVITYDAPLTFQGHVELEMATTKESQEEMDALIESAKDKYTQTGICPITNSNFAILVWP